MTIEQLQKLRDDLMEDAYRNLIKTLVQEDEDIMVMLKSFNEVGVKWETIFDAMNKYIENKRKNM